MAASELLQAQHELASRVSNQFIASRLANAKQQDQDTSRANQQLQQTRLASSSPPGSQTTSKHSIQMPNQANNSEKQQQQRGDQFYQDSNHQHHNQWQLQPVKHEEDSDSSTASEQEADPRQDESGAGQSLADQNGKPHLGPMGIFFKVWSLVKVTKSRHTRMKQRQMSEAAAQQQFQYIPGGSDHHHQFGASGLGASQLAVTGSGGPTLSPLLALPHGSGQHQYPVQHSQQHQRHLLQDGHFRRAGSQPPLSSHTERRSFHLGPVGGAPPVVTNGAQNTSSTTGTTSSSSGVSSTTSSTLATNHTTLAPDGGGAPSVLQQNSRVHNSSETSAVSAHSSVRSTANQSSGRSWTARIKRGSGGVSQPPAHPPPAPIAISTTSGGGGHRPQRASLDKRQSMQLAASQPGSQSSAEAKRQLRAQSEVRQLEELRRKAIAIAKYSTPAALIGGTKSKMSLRRFRRRLRQDSVSDDGAEEEEDEDEEEEEEDDEEDDAAAGGDDEDELVQKSTTTTTAATTTTAVAARARRRQIAPEDEDDSDLNDIYSTPNDSIQSVPSGQLMLEPSGQRRVSSSGGPQTATAAANSTTVTTTTTSSYHQNKQRQTAATANGNNNCEPLDGRAKTPSQGLYQMTKSFSTSYFNQLSGDAAAGNKSKRGHEAVAPKLAAAGSTILETFDSSNNRNLNNNNTSSKRQSAIGTRSNGSRFFISSSSSEDSSNPPQQAQSAITLTSSNVLSGPQNGHRPSSQSPGRETCPTGAGASQHQHQQQISVQSGLHYHGPTKQLMAGGGVGAAISRPSSLAVSSPNAQLVLLQSGQPSILTPNTYIVNGSSVGMVNGFEPTVMTNVAAMSPMMCALPTTTTATTNLDGNLDIHQGVHSSNRLPSCQLISTNVIGSNYKKSPSLFNMNSGNMNSNVLPQDLVQRFSSKYPWARAGNTNQNNHNNQRQPLSSFVGGARLVQPSTRQIVTVNGSRSPTNGTTRKATTASQFSVPNSVSLHDCKLASAKFKDNGDRSSPTIPNKQQQQHFNDEQLPRDGPRNPSLYSHMAQDNNNSSEYKLAQMLLELGSNSAAKDETGCTALMYAIMSENLSAFKCVIEHGVDLNDTNHDGQSALDLICSKPANETLMEMLKLMIDNRVDLDRPRKDDGSRLLDRLIREHQMPDSDKILFIDCLLHNGAKLGSSTWSAARGKHEIQLKLLKKLCQDGYFLYKKSSIEAAVFRFEYALKRIDELEQQLVSRCRQSCLAKYHGPLLDLDQQQAIIKETQQARYQTFLGLSRCERKRGFFKRALEFADMSILIDSTSYEGYYSKAHILKDIGKKEDAILTIDQTERLVSKSIEVIKSELDQLDIQEESLVFDGCFNMHDPNKSSWIEATRMELNNNLDYLTEAKRHIVRLRGEIINDEQQ